MEPKPKYKVGDTVRIVEEPYLKCPFMWVQEMTELCGTEAVIKDVFWVESRGTHGYLISTEDYCTWCENCFIIEPDLVESDIDLSVLFR